MPAMSDVTGSHDFSRNLICIEYPGVVENVDKMLETLGGLNTVSSVFSQKKRRLELRFRPDDIFSKPACGDRHSTSALLLRVKVRRRKKNVSVDGKESDVNQTDSDDPGEIISSETSVVGQISSVYRFSSMCDFQYLPVIGDSKGNIKSAYEEVVPLGVKNYSWLINPEAPLFIPPPSFSRMDMPQSYSYRRGKTEADNAENAHSKSSGIDDMYPKNVIGRTRCRRSLHTIFVSWPKLWAATKKSKCTEATEKPASPLDGNKSENNGGHSEIANAGPSCSSSLSDPVEGVIPTRPQETAVRLLRIKFLCGEPFLRIQKHLEERPIWSKNALLAVTKLTQDQLKYLLPAVAYYFANGPWRGTWARFGYDPTSHPSSRQYQTLDFRLRRIGGMRSKIKAKRSTVNCSQPYKWSSYSRPKVPVIKKLPVVETKSEDEDAEKSEDKMEALYIFRPGLLPPSMQMFYQYCDLQVPEIIELLQKLPESGPDVVCSERTGWMPPNMDEKCRDIISHYVMQKVRETSKSS